MKRIEDLFAEQLEKIIQMALERLIKPDMIVDKVSDLDEQEIERIKKEHGIEAIILDVDETLREDLEALPEVNQKWIESLQGKLKIIILSNGIDRKIEEYFANKGIDYIGFAHKPFKRNFVKACQRMQVNPENVMIVGDSLFDDVYGGKRNNMKTVLVKSVEKGRE